MRRASVGCARVLLLSVALLESCQHHDSSKDLSTSHTAPSAPSAAPSAHPLLPPTLAAGRQLAWSIEQHGESLSPADRVVTLNREPFAIVVHVRSSNSKFGLFVSASTSPETLRASRTGVRYSDLHGFLSAARFDSFENARNNGNRDLYLSDSTPNGWTECGPESKYCEGFDAPCEKTADGAACRRTIERLVELEWLPNYRANWVTRSVTESSVPQIFLVFFLPGVWHEDEEKPERDRDWLTIRWKN